MVNLLNPKGFNCIVGDGGQERWVEGLMMVIWKPLELLGRGRIGNGREWGRGCLAQEEVNNIIIRL